MIVEKFKLETDRDAILLHVTPAHLNTTSDKKWYSRKGDACKEGASI